MIKYMKKNITKILIMSLIFLFNITGIKAYEIHKIDSKVYINKDGSALVNFDMNLQTIESEILQLPIFSDNMIINHIRLDSVEIDLATEIINNGAFCYLEMPINFAQGKHCLQLQYTISNYINWEEAGPGEFKKYEFESYIENSFPTIIDTFNMSIILPKGWNYHKITGSEPVFKKKDPKPPFALSKLKELSCASISRTPMNYREKIGLEFSFKLEKKSNSIIWVSIILIGLYLFLFRNLIENKDQKNEEIDNNLKGEKHAK